MVVLEKGIGMLLGQGQMIGAIGVMTEFLTA